MVAGSGTSHSTLLKSYKNQVICCEDLKLEKWLTSGQTATWQQQQLLLPDLPPSVSSKYCTIKYKTTVSV